MGWTASGYYTQLHLFPFRKPTIRITFMLWIKTFHILFVMAWMAGLFYLPRIIVHFVEGKAAAEDVQRLIVMASKLFRFSSLMALLALGLGTWLRFGFGFGFNVCDWWTDLCLNF